MEDMKFSYLFQHEDTGCIMEQIFTLFQIEGAKGGFINECKRTFPRYYPIARRLFVGRSDIAGEDIFDGDLIELKLHDASGGVEGDAYCWELFLVQYNNDKSQFEFIDMDGCSWISHENEMRKVGNKWENHELVSLEPTLGPDDRGK